MRSYNYIHTKHIEDIANGDNEFLMELVDIFLAQIPDFISKMKSSLEMNDWPVLAREAHTAKSSVLTFGMEETGILLKSIQLKVDAKELKEVPDMVSQAFQQMEAAIPELLELKKTLV